jgi:hypothetical protein
MNRNADRLKNEMLRTLYFVGYVVFNKPQYFVIETLFAGLVEIDVDVIG